MNVKTLLALALFASMGCEASAGPVSGNALLEACEDKSDVARLGFCTGYILGYVEGQSLGTYAVVKRLLEPKDTQEANDLSGFLMGHCVPPEAVNRQLFDLAIGYIERHPERRHESARLLIWASFIEAFPCEPD